LSSHYDILKNEEHDNNADEFITIARKNHDISDNEKDYVSTTKSRKKIPKSKRLEKDIGVGTKLLFTEEGEAVPAYQVESLDNLTAQDLVSKKKSHLETAIRSMKVADIEDKVSAKQRLRDLKRIKKLKEKNIRRDEVFSFFNRRAAQ
jgi:ATP-dependent RNA helicase DDX10/DBP4